MAKTLTLTRYTDTYGNRIPLTDRYRTYCEYTNKHTVVLSQTYCRMGHFLSEGERQKMSHPTV